MHISLSHHSHKKTLKLQGSIMDRLSTDPYLDWVLIFIGMLVISTVCIGIGVVVYFSVTGRLATESVDVPVGARVVFDGDMLTRVLDQYDDRALERNAIKQGNVAIPPDPSI